ncbi:MAG: hypothetical protein AAFQ79_13155 [Pseudomonadota bacterium]
MPNARATLATALQATADLASTASEASADRVSYPDNAAGTALRRVREVASRAAQEAQDHSIGSDTLTELATCAEDLAATLRKTDLATQARDGGAVSAAHIRLLAEGIVLAADATAGLSTTAPQRADDETITKSPVISEMNARRRA